jgi:hypothetical protein
MSTEPEWLRPYLKRYLNTIGPHDWPTEADEWDDFVEGWAFALAIPSPPISEAEADAARVRLAMSPPAFKRQHLPAVIEVVLKMRERDATRRLVEEIATPPEQARAEVRSKGCPECSTPTGPTGFARRKGVWADRSWSATATLYCRCALGRYRAATNDLDPAPYDDLQALPHLWDWSRSHLTWSQHPSAPPSVEGRGWVYLAPGEAAPTPIAKAVIPPGRLARPRGRSWAGPIPENLVMPRPVPREMRPEPEPAPTSPPPLAAGETLDEEALEWL